VAVAVSSGRVVVLQEDVAVAVVVSSGREQWQSGRMMFQWWTVALALAMASERQW
jgi:hypothetical protein